MANDVTDKSTSGNNSENTSPSNSDQQKVPPLRIVLNTAGNQKTSTTTGPGTANNQQSGVKREKSQDAKTDNSLKTTGRVRIKLGTNKQQISKGSSNIGGEATTGSKTSTSDARQRVKASGIEEDISKEESNTSYSHLRRITRRSQRTVQTVTNEDDESISSMTSTDENQNSNNNTSDNSSAAQDTEQSNNNNSTAATSSNANNNGSTAETPRRYKRRKGETSESLSFDCDSLFGSQNYKLPVQNSFELFRNIRKQIDKKLKGLNSIQPRAPYGFRDYMLTRGAYLLDGNKLGNGTNLFMNEDGGLNPAPVGKYHALRHSKINYTVPNRARVPLGLPVNSPLYNLFIEQEKERYRMRMQHLKEREKLTLAAEQEIVRVYNQAALTAANQDEPFSACTLLKHQEVYNYLDSDGLTILVREDESQKDQTKPEGVGTRRRQQGQISPPLDRKNSNTEENTQSDPCKKDNKTPPDDTSTSEGPKTSNLDTQNDISNQTKASNKDDGQSDDSPTVKSEKQVGEEVAEADKEEEKPNKESSTSVEPAKADEPDNGSGQTSPQPVPKEADKSEVLPDSGRSETKSDKIKTENKREEPDAAEKKVDAEAMDICEPQTTKKAENVKSEPDDAQVEKESSDKSEQPSSGDANVASSSACESNEKEQTKDNDNEVTDEKSTEAPVSENPNVESDDKDDSDKSAPMEQDESLQADAAVSADQSSFSEDDRRAYNKEIFLSQLQEIDDKWERIRNEMLIRHRNEAESLYAVQKLEWEWKTKEIGACDVIDSTLVPKLNIYSQDY